MKVEGGGHHLRAVNDGAPTVFFLIPNNLPTFVHLKIYFGKYFDLINDMFEKSL